MKRGPTLIERHRGSSWQTVPLLPVPIRTVAIGYRQTAYGSWTRRIRDWNAL